MLNTQALALIVLEKKTISHGRLTPRGVVNLHPMITVGIIYNGDYQTLLHTKYRSSGPSSFREDLFLVFPIVSLWELSVAMETSIFIQSAPKPNAVNSPTQ